MNSLLIVILIFIIASFLYLIYRHLQFTYLIEKFDTSLSTYFQNTVDKDSMMNTTNVFDNQIAVSNNKNVGWDGIWKDNSNQNIYAQFIQNNDRLIITISNSAFDNITVSGVDGDGCPDNLFSGIAVLNNNKKIFILKQPICNRYYNSALNNNIVFTNNIVGYLNTSESSPIITLYVNGITQNIVLIREKEFTTTDETLFKNYKYGSEYIDLKDPYISTSATIPKSEFTYTDNFCPYKEGSSTEKYSPCIDNATGMGKTSYDGPSYNACGTKVGGSGENKDYCNDMPNNGGKCVIGGAVNPCAITVKTFNYINFSPFNILTKTNGDDLKVCNYLSYFNNSNCNACILCYVTNLGNVQTLNYQFMGTPNSSSSLTIQTDIMNKKINESLLSNYRANIKNNIVNDTVYNALSLTNFLENNIDPGKYVDIITSSFPTLNSYIAQYNPDNTNRINVPAVWQININQDKNITNSCTFTLSTSNLYNTQVKYVSANKDGTTSLSLFNGGIDKKFILENANVLLSNTNASNQTTFVAITGNIRSSNKLYMLPTVDNSGLFDNSNLIKLSSKPQPNGKWLLIGFSLNNLNNLQNQLDSFSFNT
jgi:hypothetical protein